MVTTLVHAIREEATNHPGRLEVLDVVDFAAIRLTTESGYTRVFYLSLADAHELGEKLVASFARGAANAPA